MDPSRFANLKRWVVLASFLLMVVLAFQWLHSHAFIEISIANPRARGSSTYQIISQDGKKTTTIHSQRTKVKRIIRAGSYQVLVERDGASYFIITETRGFLSTKKVRADLQPERSRIFVGNNPNPCMYYGQGILYSYDCSVEGGLTVHLPANENTPTTTVSETESPYIPLKGLIDLDNANKALVVDDEDRSVGLYDIDQDLRLTNPLNLRGVNASDASHIAPYKSGFVIYSDSLASVHYFAASNSLPTKITTFKPFNETSNPVELSVSGNKLGALFNSVRGGVESFNEGGAQSTRQAGKSEFVFYGQQKKESYMFDKLYTSGGLCGNNKLCLISNDILDIYNIDQRQPVYIMGVRNAQKAFSLGDDLVIATDHAVMVLNKDSLIGSVQYSYDEARYCGISKSASGYVLCLVNGKGDKVALYIDVSKIDTDNIDKKVFELLRDPSVSNISAYKNYIYISPNLGKLVYSASLGGYDYDPIVKRSVNKKITDLIQKERIDTSRYTIINPYQ